MGALRLHPFQLSLPLLATTLKRIYTKDLLRNRLRCYLRSSAAQVHLYCPRLVFRFPYSPYSSKEIRDRKMRSRHPPLPYLHLVSVLDHPRKP